GAQPVQFLADIGTGDQERQFLRHPLFRDAGGEAGQFAEQGFEAGADRGGLGGGRGGGGFDQGGEAGALIGQERRETGAFLVARGGEPVERHRPAGEHGGAAGLDNVFGILL